MSHFNVPLCITTEGDIHNRYKKAFASLGDHGDAKFDDISKQVKYHLAGKLLETKDYNFNDAPEKTLSEWLLMRPASAYDKNLEHSFKAIVGKTPVSTGDLGSLLIPPRGMSLEDFTNKFKASAKETLGKAGLSGRDYGYENARVTTDGSAQYRVTFGREYVRNPKTGNPLVIEVVPDKSEAEQTMAMMFKDTAGVMEEHKTNTVKRLLEENK